MKSRPTAAVSKLPSISKQPELLCPHPALGSGAGDTLRVRHPTARLWGHAAISLMLPRQVMRQSVAPAPITLHRWNTGIWLCVQDRKCNQIAYRIIISVRKPDFDIARPMVASGQRFGRCRFADKSFVGLLPTWWTDIRSALPCIQPCFREHQDERHQRFLPHPRR